MATPVVMPKQGNSVESCIIVEWKRQVGDLIAAGDTICDVETDKAVLEVESPADGTLLALFFAEGDEVPVMTNIAAIGAPGEDVTDLGPGGAPVESAPAGQESSDLIPAPVEHAAPPAVQGGESPATAAASPRARLLAERKQVDVEHLAGSGPQGRVIERDVEAALASQPRMSPVARAMVADGAYSLPEQGTGPGGRIMSRDLQAGGVETVGGPAVGATSEDEIKLIPVKGVRKLIAERMLSSLQSTAQLTLNASADARALLAYRKRLKASSEELGLQAITINDLLLFVVARALRRHPDLNAIFEGDTVRQYSAVHLGMAVDTPRGLLVPVIRNADGLTLKALGDEAKRLAGAAGEGRVSPDELSGGTFTVTNLGAFGVEGFTPVLNAPQVGILGVGNINLKPMPEGDEVAFVPHIGLSLTINHQVVDGAPAARFLQTLSRLIAEVDLIVAA